jgi:hypothetical protein
MWEKLRRRKFGKTDVNGADWLLGDKQKVQTCKLE